MNYLQFDKVKCTSVNNICLEKYCDLETKPHSRSLEMTPFDRSYMTSYLCFLVTMILSCIVFGTSDLEKCSDLEIKVRGQSRSSKLVPIDSLPMVSFRISVLFFCF